MRTPYGELFVEEIVILISALRHCDQRQYYNMCGAQNNRPSSCQQIREETNTKIDLPTENSNSEMIVITGKKINCEAARERILAIQRELVRERSRRRPSCQILLLAGFLPHLLFFCLHPSRPTSRRRRSPSQPSYTTPSSAPRAASCGPSWRTVAAFTSISPQRAPARTRSPSGGQLGRWRRPRNSCYSWLRKR